MAKKVYWFHGKYSYVLAKKYGGMVRTMHLMKLISRTIKDSTIVNIVYNVPYVRRVSRPAMDNARIVNLSIPSMLCRAFIKLFEKAGIVGRTSIVRLLCLRGRRKDILSIRESIDEDTIIVFDGLPGFLMAKNVLGEKMCNKVSSIYLSHNFEADFYKGPGSIVFRLDREAVSCSRLVIASSIRDRIRYQYDMEVGREKIIVFPNIYPVGFEAMPKVGEKSIAIIEGSVGGFARKAAEFLSRNRVVDTIVYVGKSDLSEARRHGVDIIQRGFIESRSEFLGFLSQAYMGLNYGEWLGGSNVKKYDYALAGLAVLSGGTGYRDIVLPGEVAFADLYDLAAKIVQLGREQAAEMGLSNRDKVLRIYKEAVEELVSRIRELVA